MRLQKRLNQGVFWASMSTVTGLLMGTAKMITIAQYVGAKQIGYYSLALILIGMASMLGSLGLGASLYHCIELSQKAYRKLTFLTILSGISSGIVSSFILILLLPQETNLGYSEVVLVILAILGQTILIVPQARLSLGLEFKLMSKLTTAQRIFGDALGILIIVQQPTFKGLLIGIALPVILGAIAHIIAAEVKSNQSPAFAKTTHDIKPPLRLGILGIGDGLLNYFVSRLDRLIVSWGYGVEALGIYEVICQLIERPFQAVSATFKSVFIAVYARFKAKRTALLTLTDTHTYAMGMILLPFFGFTAVHHDLIASVVLGSAYSANAQILIAIAILCSAKILSIPFSQFLVATGRLKVGFLITISVGFLRLIVLTLLVSFNPLPLAVLLYVLIRVTSLLSIEAWLRRRYLNATFYMAILPLKPIFIQLVILLSLSLLFYYLTIPPLLLLTILVLSFSISYTLLNRRTIYSFLGQTISSET